MNSVEIGQKYLGGKKYPPLRIFKASTLDAEPLFLVSLAPKLDEIQACLQHTYCSYVSWLCNIQRPASPLAAVVCVGRGGRQTKDVRSGAEDGQEKKTTNGFGQGGFPPRLIAWHRQSSSDRGSTHIKWKLFPWRFQIWSQIKDTSIDGWNIVTYFYATGFWGLSRDAAVSSNEWSWRAGLWMMHSQDP